MFEFHIVMLPYRKRVKSIRRSDWEKEAHKFHVLLFLRLKHFYDIQVKMSDGGIACMDLHLQCGGLKAMNWSLMVTEMRGPEYQAKSIRCQGEDKVPRTLAK